MLILFLKSLQVLCAVKIHDLCSMIVNERTTFVDLQICIRQFSSNTSSFLHIACVPHIIMTDHSVQDGRRVVDSCSNKASFLLPSGHTKPRQPNIFEASQGNSQARHSKFYNQLK